MVSGNKKRNVEGHFDPSSSQKIDLPWKMGGYEHRSIGLGCHRENIQEAVSLKKNDFFWFNEKRSFGNADDVKL